MIWETDRFVIDLGVHATKIEDRLTKAIRTVGRTGTQYIKAEIRRAMVFNDDKKSDRTVNRACFQVV